MEVIGDINKVTTESILHKVSDQIIDSTKSAKGVSMAVTFMNALLGDFGFRPLGGMTKKYQGRNMIHRLKHKYATKNN